MGAKKNSGGVSRRAANGRSVKCTLPLAKRGGVNTVSLEKLFQAPDLLKKRSIFKVLHVKEGRKNATKVFSAVVADDSAVIRLVTFGLINCQKAKSVRRNICRTNYLLINISLLIGFAIKPLVNTSFPMFTGIHSENRSFQKQFSNFHHLGTLATSLRKRHHFLDYNSLIVVKAKIYKGPKE